MTFFPPDILRRKGSNISVADSPGNDDALLKPNEAPALATKTGLFPPSILRRKSSNQSFLSSTTSHHSPEQSEADQAQTAIRKSLFPPPFFLRRKSSSQGSFISSASLAAGSSASSSATSLLPSPTTSSCPTPELKITPPTSDSEYRWHCINGQKGRVWWRTVDAMANFILHWQKRFHQHGDMFGSCTLSLSSPSSNLTVPSPEEAPARIPCTVSKAEFREAIRRLRFSHPTIALRLAKRDEFGIEPLQGIPEFVRSKVDLQVALVYEEVQGEEGMEAWLDDVAIYHEEGAEDRVKDEEQDFRKFLARATAEGVPGRDRLRVHFWPPNEAKGIDARILVEQCHSVSEGIGTLLVFDLILASIADVLADSTPRNFEWGREVCRLEPGLQDAIANPPSSWEVPKAERKQVEKVNSDRMNGKSTAPNMVDKLGGKVVALTLANHASSNALRSKFLNKPLVGVCRGVAEKGDMLPLGLLPQTGVAFDGKITHTEFISESLDEDQTKLLLRVLKSKGLTLAPFLEAASHMATTWTRKYRGLTPPPTKANGGWDEGERILGSFSNAISKRDTLRPEHQRYLGLCMSGFPTKIAASSATWSPLSSPPLSAVTPNDPLPNVTTPDLTTLFSITKDLATQYSAGRNNPNWLRYDKSLMFGTMAAEYLFLRNSAHYPSMPWLSSIGKLENVFAGSHPITPPPPAEQQGDLAKTGSTLEAHNMRLLGRVGIRQPILHVYTFRGQTTIQFSFADWLYNPPTCDGRKMHRDKGGKKKVRVATQERREEEEEEQQGERQNILSFWLKVYRTLIEAVLASADDLPATQ